MKELQELLEPVRAGPLSDDEYKELKARSTHSGNWRI
jgi:hypothetical protein